MRDSLRCPHVDLPEETKNIQTQHERTRGVVVCSKLHGLVHIDERTQVLSLVLNSRRSAEQTKFRATTHKSLDKKA